MVHSNMQYIASQRSKFNQNTKATKSHMIGNLALGLILSSYFFAQAFNWYALFLQTDGSPDTSATTAIRLALQVPLLAGFSLVLWYGAFRQLPAHLRLLAWAASMCFLFSLARGLLGILMGDYRVYYVFGDAFRFLVSWGGFFGVIGSRMLLGYNSEKALRRLLNAVIFIAVLDGIATILIYFTFSIFKISTTAYIPGIFIGLAYLSSYPFRPIPLIALGFVAMIISGKRSPIISSTLTLAIATALSIGNLVLRNPRGIGFSKNRLSRAGLAIMALLLAVSIFLIGFQMGLDTFIGGRGTSLYQNVLSITRGFTGEEEIDSSFNSRLLEQKNIEEHFSNNLLELPLGSGFGAEIQMVFDTGVETPSGRMHHAHITWTVYTLRNGIFGVFLVAAYFVIVGSQLGRRAFSNKKVSMLAMAGFLQLLYNFFSSTNSNIMLENFSILPAIATAWTITPKMSARRSTTFHYKPAV